MDTPKKRGRPALTDEQKAARTAQKSGIGVLPQRTTQRMEQRPKWRARRTIEEIEETGRYYIDPSSIPDGMDYQFKALTVMGEEMREHQIRLARDGAWDPVPASRHPELMGKYLDKLDPNQAIIIGGQILMERPKVYSQQAQAENDRAARSRVSNHFQSLGLNDGGGPPKMKPQVKRDYSVQAVPDDDAADATA